MERETKLGLLFIGAVVLVLLLAGRKKQTTSDEGVIDDSAEPNNSQFYYPYYQTTPGIIDQYVLGDTVFGGATFNQNFNVTGGTILSDRYIPLFGFVGSVAFGG